MKYKNIECHSAELSEEHLKELREASQNESADEKESPKPMLTLQNISKAMLLVSQLSDVAAEIDPVEHSHNFKRGLEELTRAVQRGTQGFAAKYEPENKPQFF
ncbi:hypothetical protein PR048_007059 [Dryococelus australis]|uniref:Uncharacterized protein n=1 Tax=Dryococelus australis TaxID=614101 RepID=A0ABQ9ICK2_9NEOP|nr:hypothetical protein PR048_007059 [Dryococelus australis]